METNRLNFTVEDADGESKKYSFVISPTIGHCIELQRRGVDLLGTNGDAAIEKLVANPVAFCEILEVVIGSENEQFKMPAIAGLMTGATWTNSRRVVLGSFRDFFQSSGHAQLAAALDRLTEAAEAITEQVAVSLNSGELKQKIEAEVGKMIGAMTAAVGGD